MTFTGNYSSDIPTLSRPKFVKSVFSALSSAQKRYERCEEIDDLSRRYFIGTTNTTNSTVSLLDSSSVSAAPVSTADRELYDRSVEYDKPAAHHPQWSRVSGSLKSSPSVEMFVRLQSSSLSSSSSHAERLIVDDKGMFLVVPAGASDPESSDPESSSSSSSSEAPPLWGKAIGDVDESINDVFAWIWQVCSYERMRMHRTKHGGLLRRSAAAGDDDSSSGRSRSQIFSSETTISPGLKSRRQETKMTWLRQEDAGTVSVCFEPVGAGEGGRGDESSVVVPPPGFSKSSIAATTTGMYMIKEVSPRITTLTVVQTLDLGGSLPTWLRMSLLVNALSLVGRVQDKFRRIDADVDRERQATIASRIRSSACGVPQSERAMFESCASLKEVFEKESSRHLIRTLIPSSPFIECFVSAAHPDGDDDDDATTRGKRDIATGKGVAEIDSSIEGVAAWLFDPCSRVRMRKNKEDNDGLPRIVTWTNGCDSLVMGTMKLMPFPFWRREFVVRMSWAKKNDGHLWIWARPVDDRLNYGVELRKVKGRSSILYDVAKVRNDLCRVSIYQRIDPRGSIPAEIVNMKIGVALSIMTELRDYFCRDNDVDVVRRDELVQIMRRRQEEKEEEEEVYGLAEKRAMLTSLRHWGDVTEIFRQWGSSKFRLRDAIEKHLGCSVHFCVSPSKQKGRQVVAVRAEYFVDESAEKCAAWDFLQASRARAMSLYDNDNCDTITEESRNNHWRTFTQVYGRRMQIGEFRISFESFWRRYKDGIYATGVVPIIAPEQRRGPRRIRFSIGRSPTEGSIEEEDNAIEEYWSRKHRSALSVRSTKSSSTKFTPLSNAVASLGVAQTQVTMSALFESDLGLARETLFAVLQSTVRHLSEMRLCFDKTVLIDGKQREVFCNIVSVNNETYDEEELNGFKRVVEIGSAYEKQKKKSDAKTSSPLTVATTSVSADKNEVWGAARTRVRVPAVEVMAFLSNSMARNQYKTDTRHKTYLEEPSNHNRLEYYVKKFPRPFADREFCQRTVWKYIDDNTLILYSIAEWSHARCGKDPSLVLATLAAFYKLRHAGARNDEADVEVLLNLHFGGTPIPLFLQEFYCGYNLRRVTVAQQYFQELRVLRDYDAQDGVAVGEAFMIKSKEEKEKSKTYDSEGNRHNTYNIRVANVVSKHVALKEFAAKNPWFPSLVEGMLCNWLSDAKIVKTKLDNLSNMDALTIGRSFALTLYDREQAELAADMFVHEYSSLVEFSKRHPFFLPMTVVIGQRKLEKAPWGRGFKVGSLALLGAMDVATDVLAIANFARHGEYFFAMAVVGMVSFSMAIQFFVVYANGSKRGKRHLAKEALLLFIGLKPAFDAYRIITGEKQRFDEMFNPQFEFLCFKLTEM